MNRYTASGIFDDVLAGKEVIILGHGSDARDAFVQLAAMADDNPGCGFKIYRANGRQQIQGRRGRIRFLPTVSSLRGHKADTIYVTRLLAEVLTPDDRIDLLVSAPEVIRA